MEIKTIKNIKNNLFAVKSHMRKRGTGKKPLRKNISMDILYTNLSIVFMVLDLSVVTVSICSSCP